MKKAYFWNLGRRGFLTSPGQRVQALLKSIIILAVLSLLTFGPQTTFAQNVPYKVLEGHTRSVSSVVFSPDGSRLASRSDDNTIRLWDGVSGELITTLEGLWGSVSSVVFSPDGSRLASDVGTLRLWDGVSGELIARLEGHRGSVSSVVFSPDGSRLASASVDNTVRLWDGVSGELIATLEGHTDWVRSVVFSPDGSRLASASVDETVRLWYSVNDIGTDTVLANVNIATLEGHTLDVFGAVFSPDGSRLASVSWDNTIRLWDATTGEHMVTLESESEGSSYTSLNASSPDYGIAFSPDGIRLASLMERQYNHVHVHLWNAITGAQLGIPYDLGSVQNATDTAFSPDGSKLFVSGMKSSDGRKYNFLYILNGFTGRFLQTGDTSSVWHLMVSPDSGGLTTGNKADNIALATRLGIMDNVEWTVFSPDGSRLVTGDGGNTILLWDLGHVRGNVRFTPSSVVPPAVGSQMTVNLAIVGGEHVAGYQASVWFDPTALRFIKSTAGAYLPANAFFAPPKIVGNKVSLMSTSGTEERDGDGILATLTFEVVAVKHSTLTLSDVILSSNSGEFFYPTIENARVLGTVGDISGDGVVNVADLVLVAGQIGKRGENSADVNGDGVVNIADLVLVAGALDDAAAAPAVWNQKQIEVLSTVDVQAWLSEAQQLNLTNPTSQRGILYLKQLLAALTPKETQLLANYPNPFNPETWMPFQLAKSANVKISIYAADGKLIRMLDLGHQPIGIYQSKSRAAYWNGKNKLGEPVASGVYFYTLTAGDFTATRKMVIRK